MDFLDYTYKYGMKGSMEMLGRMVEDRRVGPVHVAVYVALCWYGEDEFVRGGNLDRPHGTFMIKREIIMQRAKVQGRTTYYKTMKELDAWGYIEYHPGRHSSGTITIREEP